MVNGTVLTGGVQPHLVALGRTVDFIYYLLSMKINYQPLPKNLEDSELWQLVEALPDTILRGTWVPGNNGRKTKNCIT